MTFTDNGDRTATLAGTPAADRRHVSRSRSRAANGSAPPVTQTFTLTVHQAPAITSANTATFNIGSVGSTFTVTTTGSPTPDLSISGALPSGITFTDNDNGTATLGGTAAAGTSGTYPLVITASNGVGTAATQNFTLTISRARRSPARTRRRSPSAPRHLHRDDDRVADRADDHARPARSPRA